MVISDEESEPTDGCYGSYSYDDREENLMDMNYLNAYTYQPGYLFARPKYINSINFDQYSPEPSDSEENEDEEGSWYKIPSHATYDETTKVLILDDVPFTERILEFMSKGSVRLFRAKVCNQKTLKLIAQSRVYKEQTPTTPQDLSVPEAIAHLVESPTVKSEGVWKLPKKGHLWSLIREAKRISEASYL